MVERGQGRKRVRDGRPSMPLQMHDARSHLASRVPGFRLLDSCRSLDAARRAGKAAPGPRRHRRAARRPLRPGPLGPGRAALEQPDSGRLRRRPLAPKQPWLRVRWWPALRALRERRRGCVSLPRHAAWVCRCAKGRCADARPCSAPRRGFLDPEISATAREVTLPAGTGGWEIPPGVADSSLKGNAYVPSSPGRWRCRPEPPSPSLQRCVIRSKARGPVLAGP